MSMPHIGAEIVTPTYEHIPAMVDLYHLVTANAREDWLINEAYIEPMEDHFNQRALNIVDELGNGNQNFYVALGEQGVVGMIGFNVTRSLVHSLYIQADLKGQGIARKLLTTLTDNELRRPLFAHVAEPNVNSLGFFKHHGFAETGVVKNWRLSASASIPEVELRLDG